ncbi:16S rRNA (guanine(966)-N(2))-methyltransferase RsmD [Fructilactobacillus vespulae]|uniref:16S rRNA (guanine(966)-N(2))-methyltransferase RsmD n=1 Tax=Fructilactobacillus vespulae TaxID=1249630 RepID=UPI0039B536BB
MRIISGKFGGRRIQPVPGTKTRPTTDKVKESLFNMIGPYFDGEQTFLDLFAGSGAVAIEAVSRGIKQAVLVDRQFAAYKTIKNNVEIAGDEKNNFKVLKMDAEQALKKLKGKQFNYIFLDPPYAEQQMRKQLAEIKQDQLIASSGIVICETDNKTELSEMDGYELIKQKNYGLTIITIYKNKE